MRKFFTLVFLITVCFSYALAQTKTITGTVKDGSTMESLPGVTITSSSGQSTQTNADGYFSIEVSSNANITITFIGYKPQTIPVSSQSTYNIFLERDSQELEEVVVVGYGTQKKADVTGSIGSVKGEEIAKQPSMSAMQSVQGKVAGLNIVASENPGSAPTVMIRGLGTA
ncbi:carboxypeptidase-like regulatory domain-containing protein [Sphingobacterium sp. T2]|nr:carboxypeptidase-like regulatory domain-containing protein [Sphingobacterium sp. T2]